MTRRNKQELRAILEIITPVAKDILIGPLLFLLIFGVLFFGLGFGPK